MSEIKKQKNTPSKETSPTSTTINSTNPIMFAIIGILLGLVVGYVFTDTVNKSGGSMAATKASKAGPLKGNEDMPANHPSIDEVEGQIKQALEFGEKNQDYDSQLKVGSYLYSQGRMLEDAKRFLLKANELKPNEFDPLAQLGNLHFDMGREKNDPNLMKEAISWYEKAGKIKPDDLNVITDTGISYMFLNPPDIKKAMEYLDKTLSKDPKHLQALYHKTKAYIDLKDLKLAEESFAKFKEFASADPNEMVKEALKGLEQDLNKAKGGVSTSVPIPTH